MNINLFIYFFIVGIIFSGTDVRASIINGTISASDHSAQVCETTSCTVSGTSPVNFGYFTNSPSSNVSVTDSSLSGYIWGSSFGWAVLNCSNTTSGCSATNGNFKVANDANGHLSGYAWGENSGWINFGPFSNSGTSPVTIDSSGSFNGYAWSQNKGWIKFDCSNSNFCVKTDWRPQNTRPQCSDGVDNDSDGSIDSADRGCHTDNNASNDASYDPTDITETNSGGGSGGGSSTTTGSGTGTVGNGTGTSGATTGSGTAGVSTTGGVSAGGTGTAGATTSTGVTTVNPNPPSDQPLNPPSDPQNPPSDQPLNPPSDLTPPSDTPIEKIGETIQQTITTVTQTIGDVVSSLFGGSNSGQENASREAVSQITNAISENARATKIAVRKASDKTAEIINTPTGDVVTKTVTTAGVVAGASVTIATALFANPLTLAELVLIPVRLWGLLMAALGIKKRNRPWGTVYDSVTKQPLDPAYVVLQDLNGNEIATSITDIDGRFGFLVPPGVYRIVANKTNYQFPSKILAGKTGDEIYQELYSNQDIEITADGVITKNIPMDPVDFDWNEFAKKQQGLMRFHSIREVWLARLSNALFGFGFVVTLIAVVASPKVYNMATLGVYVVLYILKHTVLKPRPFGRISDTSGRPLSFAIVRVCVASDGREFSHKIADKDGKYYCLVPNGSYFVKIEGKNPDGSYTLQYTSETLEVKDGYINRSFEV